MKKTLFTIEFIFVLVLFVFPYFLPAFSPAEVQLIEMKVTLSGFMMFFWAVLLFIFNFSLYREKQIRLCEEKNMVCGFLALKDFRLHCYVLVAAGLIFIISAVCTGLEFWLASKGFSFPQLVSVMPEGFPLWASFACAVLMSSFFEETVYRFFIPDGLQVLFNGKFIPLTEICALLFFSLGHRYLGIPGVLNAVLSGAVLRLLFVKTRSIWINTLVHAFYNSAVYLMAAML